MQQMQEPTVEKMSNILLSEFIFEKYYWLRTILLHNNDKNGNLENSIRALVHIKKRYGGTIWEPQKFHDGITEEKYGRSAVLFNNLSKQEAKELLYLLTVWQNTLIQEDSVYTSREKLLYSTMSITVTRIDIDKYY